MNYKYFKFSRKDFQIFYLVWQAERNNISRDLVSYMTYVLQPFYDNMKNIPVEVREILHFEYTEKMDAIGKESRKNTLFSWTSLEILDASPSGFAPVWQVLSIPVN